MLCKTAQKRTKNALRKLAAAAKVLKKKVRHIPHLTDAPLGMEASDLAVCGTAVSSTGAVSCVLMPKAHSIVPILISSSYVVEPDPMSDRIILNN